MALVNTALSVGTNIVLFLLPSEVMQASDFAFSNGHSFAKSCNEGGLGSRSEAI